MQHFSSLRHPIRLGLIHHWDKPCEYSSTLTSSATSLVMLQERNTRSDRQPVRQLALPLILPPAGLDLVAPLPRRKMQ